MFLTKKVSGYENLTQHAGKLKIYLPVVSRLNCRQVQDTKPFFERYVTG
jgi:hypothetical protein